MFLKYLVVEEKNIDLDVEIYTLADFSIWESYNFHRATN
jgi:hypothetical protein